MAETEGARYDQATIAALAVEATNRVFRDSITPDEGAVFVKNIKLGLNDRRVRFGEWGHLAFHENACKMVIGLEFFGSRHEVAHRFTRWAERFNQMFEGGRPNYVKLDMRTDTSRT